MIIETKQYPKQQDNLKKKRNYLLQTILTANHDASNKGAWSISPCTLCQRRNMYIRQESRWDDLNCKHGIPSILGQEVV